MQIEPARVGAPLESGTEDDAVELAENHGWVSRKLKWIGRVGAPDRVFYGYGRTVFIEFKKPKGGRRSPAQKREINRMKKAGLEAHFCKDLGHFRVLLGIE